MLDVRNCGLGTLLLLSKQTLYRKIFEIVILPSIHALRKDRKEKRQKIMVACYWFQSFMILTTHLTNHITAWSSLMKPVSRVLYCKFPLLDWAPPKPPGIRSMWGCMEFHSPQGHMTSLCIPLMCYWKRLLHPFQNISFYAYVFISMLNCVM